jgi:hypothetical protein
MQKDFFTKESCKMGWNVFGKKEPPINEKVIVFRNLTGKYVIAELVQAVRSIKNETGKVTRHEEQAWRKQNRGHIVPDKHDQWMFFEVIE